MRLFRFIRTPKPQRFEYKPRHWNPEKEDLERRVKAAQNRQDSSPGAMKDRITQNMRRSYRAGKQKSAFNLRYNLLLLGIIIVLLIASYYILTVYLPQMEDFLR